MKIKKEKKEVKGIRIADDLWNNFRITCIILNLSQTDAISEMINNFIISHKFDVNFKLFLENK